MKQKARSISKLICWAVGHRHVVTHAVYGYYLLDMAALGDNRAHQVLSSWHCSRCGLQVDNLPTGVEWVTIHEARRA